ncbi:MAG: type VI secretion system tip protein TssI/VgrG [Polyangiaceae bacterium]
MTTSFPQMIGSLFSEASSSQLFELQIDGLPAELRVVAVDGHEAVSELFSFDVTVVAPLDNFGADEAVQRVTELASSALRAFSPGGSDADLSALEALVVGRDAKLVLRATEQAPRVIQGICISLDRRGPVRSVEEGLSLYRIRVAPKLHLATLRENTRIFQNTTVKAIVNQVLEDYSIACRWDDSAETPGREYCVQYRESDFDFVARILAEAGMFFFFEPAGTALVEAARAGGLVTLAATLSSLGELTTEPHVVFASTAHMYAPLVDATLEGAAQALLDDVLDAAATVTGMSALSQLGALAAPGLPFRPEAGLATDGRAHVRELALERTLRPQTVELRDYDFERPLLPLVAASRSRLPGRGSPHEAQTGSEVASALPVPFPLELYEHEGDYARPHVDTTRARLILEQARATARVGRGVSTAIGLAAGTRFKLEEHPNPVLNREYAITRIHHRGHVPEWARAHGSSEAIFENRFDCVPAEIAARPARPQPKVVSVLETAVVVGPADHEIHTDRHGRVKVQFHWDRQGGRDEHSSAWLRVMAPWAGAGWGHQFLPRIGMEVTVAFLGGDPDKPVVTGALYNEVNPPTFALPGSATRSGIRTRSTPNSTGHNELSFEDAAGEEEIFLRAERDLREEVRQNREARVRGSDTRAVEGEQRLTVQGRARESYGDLHEEEVRRDRNVVVHGNANNTVSGDRRAVVRGRDSTAVHDSLELRVDGDATHRIGGCHTILVGSASAPRSLVAHVEGVMSLSSSRVLELSSETQIVLRCGASRVIIADDGIYLDGPKIVQTGESSSSLVGAKIELKSDNAVTAQGGSVTLTSASGGAVKIEAGVEASGSSISLKSASASVESEASESKPKTTIELVGHDGKGVAGARYRISTDDGETGGVLDRDGQAELELEGSARISVPDHALEDEDDAGSGRRTVVAGPHDHLAQIAAEHGFSADELWQADANATLREQRANPQVLRAGDVLVVPLREPSARDLHVGQLNSFSARVPMLDTEVRFFDADGPLASKSCRIEGLEPEPVDATTDGDGVLTIHHPANHAAVTVVFPDMDARYELTLGGLDPVEEASGAQMRLAQLGHFTGAVSDTWSDAARAALRQFQAAAGLDESGEPDAATLDALRNTFGS